MEKPTLHFGLMTYEELAAWKGGRTTVNGIKNQPKKFLEELSSYCEFDRVKENGKYVGVNVKRIYGSVVYLTLSRKASPAYFIMLDFLPKFFKEKQEHIGSIAEAARVAEEEFSNTNFSLNTWEKQGRNARNYLFGDGLTNKRGKIGTSEYVFCVSRGGKARPFTEVENKRCVELLHKYYSRSDENVKQQALLDSLVKEGELSVEAAKEKKEKLDKEERKDNYETFRKAFNGTLMNGEYLIRGIKCVEYESGNAFFMEED
jgi:hypothetical protein